MTGDPKLQAADPLASPEDDTPSLPLYVAGLIVSLAGILAVTTTVEDQNLTVTTLLLTVIGFIFSVGCRYLKVRLHIAEILILGIAGYVVYQIITGQFDWHTLASHNQMDIGIVFAWALTAWSWAVISDSLLLLSALLSMAAIGLTASVNIDGPVEICFIAFLVSSLYLMSQHLYLVKRDQAPPTDRQRAMRQLWGVQLVVVGVGAAAVFLTASVVVVPAEVVFKGLSLAQAIQGLATLSQPNKNGSISGPNVADDSDLEIGTGQGWGATTDVVALVQPSDKQPHYWKARSYDQYTGAGWSSSLDGEFNFVTGHPSEQGGTTFDLGRSPAGQPSIKSEFDIRGNTREFFYTGDLQSLTIGRPTLQMDICLDGHAELMDHSTIRSLYQTVSTTQPDPMSADWAGRLRAAGTDFPPSVKRIYGGEITNEITTPDDIEYFHRTVSSVVDTLPSDHRTEYDEVRALTQYVSSRAVYTLSVAPLPAGTDHVRSFLQDTRQGYCDMFASSLAVLCRIAGFPSRVVTGFAPGNFDGTRYALRVMDKHAWTEVYFPHFGWVPFDATIGSATSMAAPTSQHRTRSLWSRLRAMMLDRGPVVPILFGVIVLILAYIIKVEVIDGLLRRLRQRGGAPASREELGRQYERMVKSIGNLGLRRKSSETPLEFAARAVPYLEDLGTSLGTPLESDTVEVFTKLYTVVRYGGEENRKPLPADADPQLSTFLRHARRARVKRVLRRLRPRGSSRIEPPSRWGV
jgi:hypothetical protein